MTPFLISILCFVIVLPVICIIVISVIKMMTGGRKNKQRDEEEARLIHDIHQGLHKMEERVNSLETLIIQKERRDTKK